MSNKKQPYQDKCMIDGCATTKVWSRGLCRPHYFSIRNMVKKGKAEWGMFVEKGMCLEAQISRGGKVKKLLIDMMVKKGL